MGRQNLDIRRTGTRNLSLAGKALSWCCWPQTTAALAALILATAGSAAGQDNDVCLMCHENEAFFAGKEDPSRYVVTREAHEGSLHGARGVLCTDCHRGLAFPHPETPQPADCSVCHNDQATRHAISLHGQAAARGDPLAPSCSDCHGTHDIRANSDPRAMTYVFRIPQLCGRCHQEGTEVSRTRDIPQDQILQNYSMSIHGAGLFRQGLAVTAVCTSCHTSHFILPHTDVRSTIHESNVSGTCTQCHALIEEVHQQVIEGRLWEEEPHVIPVCVDCHEPHKVRRVFYDAGAANADCMRCHSDPQLTMERDGETVSLYVDELAYNASKHGGTGCAQCHADVTPSLIVRACTTSVAANVDCAICHAGPVDDYTSGMHGFMAAEGVPEAPTCLDCHDHHATQDNIWPTSPTFASNVPELCARCHREGEPAARRIEEAGYVGPDIVNSYVMSIHGKGLLESGLVVTATCPSCHTAHKELPPKDPESSVHRDNISETCGTCHHGIEEEYSGSIHWIGREDAPEDRELPNCEDCHTSHTISRTGQGDFRLTMMDQCGRCHEEESETFFDTFHGKVSRLGDAAAAKCYDCHGTHNIRPTTDALSTLSRRNIVETCADCHPGANRRFTGYLTHATHHDPERYPYLFWTFWGMTALLVGTLTLATFHTLAWLWRLWRSPEEWVFARKHREPAPGERLYRRFTTFERSLHLVMLLSFFVLAITGMTLKFSYMVWAQVLAGAVGGFATTGVLHRLAAIALITVFLIHLGDVYRRKQASGKNWKEFIFSDSSLIFNKTDLKEFIASAKWFLGTGPRPYYGRYTYWEKFDYFAVFWGMFIIGSTGLLLWFPEFFTLLLPGWTVNVATILHSDEALLAVAFIFTVHFFNTHFRPDKFPIDPVIFTGRITVEELKHDKPREYEQLVRAGRLEEYMTHQYPAKLQRVFKVFGFSALAVGLALIFLILYSMLTAYL
ncbi:MAG: cytochrome c3 family protein [Gemmatimonadota bacterium]|nr:MAG: cytochrome c3 family protein [Gemmatimonadota bacterium]